jgi:hypothetical protein
MYSSNNEKPDFIEEKIIQVLNEIPSIAEKESWQWKRGRWTIEIKERLCRLAHSLKSNDLGLNEMKLTVCATVEKGDEFDYGEWLYDMTWCIEDGNKRLLRVFLALESELSPDSELDPDFQKLLQARAEHRIFIFQDKTIDDITQKIKIMKDQIEQFNFSQSGDRYLFAGLGYNPRKFSFEIYVHKK